MEEQKPKVQNIEQVKNFWTNFTESYSTFDSFTQTFYYTLIHMLDLDKAKHILEVACGTCRLLPMAASLKAPETTYLATDLTQSMVDVAFKRLQKNLQKAGIKETAEEWIERNNITIKSANGEEPIESPHKFDRIIANLVLMATEDPLKMMKNLSSMAEQGCLFGLTIWGNKELSNFMTLIPEAMKAKGLIQGPPPRSPFHLYGKIEQLAEQSGWQVVLSWQQNVPLPHTSFDQGLMAHIKFASQGNQEVIDYIVQKTKDIFASKKALNFPCQLAILRKK